MRTVLYGIGVMGLVLFAGVVQAASLRVSPTNLEMTVPGSAGILTLTNEAKRPINVQIRVFRWTQVNGAEQLDPTNDVVVSPPSTSLSANKDYAIRVLRVAKKPVVGEESYRVIVDELPDPSRKKAGAVTLVVRYSIPVFFKDQDATPPKVDWGIAKTKGSLVLTARNTGDMRLRLADVQLTQQGRVLGAREGLVGYVLGGASMQWPIAGGHSVSAGSIGLKAQSESGLLNADIAISGR
ncbi:fimbrial biogenesis chaperone [Phyllobacterium sophorae]|jgi:fimbrial chaperone protein|uniref:Pilus assembly protein n=1 Tax=Phyllobacterium sophorae TaxID=1520277 RepID=A0A2P7BIC0_9HYPH|nr:molecular chaperone [Phyllobacterium sophorae]PSH66219.1 pilus assembly protein [Phyllobacterium sophorae]